MSEKARNLEVLAAAGIDVPKGFTLAAQHYRAAMQSLAEPIVAALPFSSLIEEIFLGTALPPETMKFLSDQLAQFPEAEWFAVRSSGAVVGRRMQIREDSASVSLAGQFSSFLAVPRELVPRAVQRVWASLYNERSVCRFAADRDYVLGSVMTVLIQEMVPADACAVMMTCDPMGNGETGAIECSLGPCEAIVAGMVTPDEICFDRGSGRVISTSIGSKAWQVEYGEFAVMGDNATKIATAAEDRARLSLSAKALEEIIDLGRRIEHIFGRPQDVELVVTGSDRIVVTQSRAVTTLPVKTIPFGARLAA